MFVGFWEAVSSRVECVSTFSRSNKLSFRRDGRASSGSGLAACRDNFHSMLIADALRNCINERREFTVSSFF